MPNFVIGSSTKQFCQVSTMTKPDDRTAQDEKGVWLTTGSIKEPEANPPTNQQDQCVVKAGIKPKGDSI
jgi:hypothetical protein